MSIWKIIAGVVAVGGPIVDFIQNNELGILSAETTGTALAVFGGLKAAQRIKEKRAKGDKPYVSKVRDERKAAGK